MTEEEFPPKMSLPVAIGALKELNEWLKIYYRVDCMDGIAALDVVIAEVEKHDKNMEDFALWVNENYSIEPELSSPNKIVWYEGGFLASETFTTAQLRELWEIEIGRKDATE